MTLTKTQMHSKLPEVGRTIFSIMTALAKENKAINLSQGFPDFECDRQLIDWCHHFMQKGFNQYAPMNGVQELREKIIEKTQKIYAANYNANTEICVTAGGTQAIFTAITSIVEINDEVIVFSPAYDCYQPAIQLCGGKTIFIDLEFPNFSIDWEKVKSKINTKTKLIIINNPNNPAGSLLSKQDIVELENIVQQQEIYVLSDEVYEHIVFDNQKHISLSSSKILREKSFIVSSFGKTYHTTGWKMGYCLAPYYLMNEFYKVHQFNVFSVNTPLQMAYAEILKNETLYLNLSNFYQEKRDYFRKLISSSRFKILPCNGTYFQLLDYSEISYEQDVEFAKKLTIEKGIAAIPISVFYNNKTDNKILRFCFAKNEKTLEMAAEKINDI